MSVFDPYYKAIASETKQWVYGYLVKKVDPLLGIDNWYILEQEVMGSFHKWHHVFRDTVCVWTGLYDRNDKRIFENDLLRIVDSKRLGLPAPVEYSRLDAAFMIRRSAYNPIEIGSEIYKDLEVVGNVYDKEVK